MKLITQKSVLLFFLFFLFFTQGVYAEPSVKDTIQFITEKIEVCKNLGDRYTERIIVSNISKGVVIDGVSISSSVIKNMDISVINDDLRIEIESEVTEASSSKKSELQRREHKLAIAKLIDLSPVTEYLSDETSSFSLVAFMHPGRIALKCSLGNCWELETKSTDVRTDKVDKETSMKAELTIPMCNNDSAKRLSKAFSHLIRISGGKESLF